MTPKSDREAEHTNIFPCPLYVLSIILVEALRVSAVPPSIESPQKGAWGFNSGSNEITIFTHVAISSKEKKKEGKRERICCLFSFCLSTNFRDLTKGQNWRKGQFLWISSLEIGCLFTASLLSINRIFLCVPFFLTRLFSEMRRRRTLQQRILMQTSHATLQRSSSIAFTY